MHCHLKDLCPFDKKLVASPFSQLIGINRVSDPDQSFNCQFVSMQRPVEVEPAKSSRSTCKGCHQNILKGELRAKVIDDREFVAYLRHNPGAEQSEGYFRGYFEDMDRVISIKKFFVHLQCYQPIHSHPMRIEYFKPKGMKSADRKILQKWLANKSDSGVQQKVRTPKKLRTQTNINQEQYNPANREKNIKSNKNPLKNRKSSNY